MRFFFDQPDKRTFVSVVFHRFQHLLIQQDYFFPIPELFFLFLPLNK